MESNKLKLAEEVIYDRGEKGLRQVKGVTIITPDKPSAKKHLTRKDGNGTNAEPGLRSNLFSGILKKISA